jgi:hypothetical protein
MVYPPVIHPYAKMAEHGTYAGLSDGGEMTRAEAETPPS